MSDSTIDWKAVLHAVDTAHGDLEYAMDCVDEYHNKLYDDKLVLKDDAPYMTLAALVGIRNDLKTGMNRSDRCGKIIRRMMRLERRQAAVTTAINNERTIDV